MVSFVCKTQTVNLSETIPAASGLMAALAIGLLIGLERGWQERELSEGRRVAGFRTFALTGLLGGLLSTLAATLGAWPLLGGLLGISVLLAVSYRKAADLSGNLSITSAIALLITLVLGAMAASDMDGAIATALAAAVIVAVLLNRKPMLHGWLRQIEHQELSAALQLLVLSVVILPNLPNTGYGPYAALNPYLLWWAVVMIAALSLAGHLAMRITGAQRGILWTGLLGGLASSTAATLALARLCRQQPEMCQATLAGMLAASGVMFLRMLVLVGMIDFQLLPTFGLALTTAGASLLLMGLREHKNAQRSSTPAQVVESLKPFDLTTALGFGLFLAAMAILVPATQEILGNQGIHLLAFISGFADVDAIVITLLRMHATAALTVEHVVMAMGLATLANMISKAAIARAVAGNVLGLGLSMRYLLAMLLGAAAALPGLLL